MSKEAMKLALEALEEGQPDDPYPHSLQSKAITAIREALADSTLDRMAENAREIGLDYEPPCKTGSQCTNKCQQCEQPAQQQEEPKRWAVFCSQCRKEWSVSYPHPGKSICAECDAKVGAQQQEPVAWMYQCSADSSGPVLTQHKKDWAESGSGLWTEKPLYTSPQPAQQQSAERVEPVAYDKTEINCFAQDLYDQKMREGKRGHYESMFHVIHQCIKKVSPPASKPWVGLTDEDLAGCDDEELKQARYWEAKLREKNA